MDTLAMRLEQYIKKFPNRIKDSPFKFPDEAALKKPNLKLSQEDKTRNINRMSQGLVKEGKDSRL